MADITTQAAGAAAAGVGSVIISLIGVEPQALIWAFVGASIGLSIPGQTGRWRAILLFVPVVLSGALVGSWGSAQFFGGAVFARNVGALAAGILFHPCVSWAVAATPRALDGVLRRLGVGQ